MRSVVGAVAVALSGRFRPTGGVEWIAAPIVQAPQWSVQAMLELVVPLAITVLVVQNGQGVAVLRSAGHPPPVNVITIACGVWSLLTAAVGTVSTCLTGPTNALLAASGERSRQYTAGVVCGLLAMVFGLFAPLFTRLMLATPVAFIATLGGLAMLRVLQSAFVTAFGRPVHPRRARHVRGDGRRREGPQHRGGVLGAASPGSPSSWLLERFDFASEDD